MAKPSVYQPEAASLDVQARKLPRKPLFLRIADSGPDSAIIMDISVGGALIRTSQPLNVDDVVSITLPHGPLAEARVTWSNGPLAGCQFVTPISEATVSAALLKSDPVPADMTPRALAEAAYVDAPDPHRMALGVPVILGSSLLLWGMIAGVVALF
ncbi:PilZ domain-containing protein [Sphingobium algorifonticola]|uniref:PilZ domain-containing protein n=1 Tax=Sphingobium algorifonticola TaxID=2008318 RepID=UPI0013E3CCF8|nr:PilZ domain-containing protein [Sphingobium algorifonticola]